MSGVDVLLTLQDLDTHADQLRHRMDALPERSALESQMSIIAAHEGATRSVREQRDLLAREQKRLEDGVSGIEIKIAEVNGLLYGGSITSPRDLVALQDELVVLARRQSGLEDEILALMEQVEPLDEQLERRRDELALLDGEAERLTAAVAEAETSIAAELAEVLARREEVASGISDDLASLYSHLRSQHGGVGVARLNGNRCEGCHLTLSAVEVDRIKHLGPGELAYCEECGRLLVR